MKFYSAKLIGDSGEKETLEFSANNDAEAWRKAHDRINPLNGIWVEVRSTPDPQMKLNLETPVSKK